MDECTDLSESTLKKIMLSKLRLPLFPNIEILPGKLDNMPPPHISKKLHDD